MILLNKVLPIFVLPFGVTLLLMIMGLMLRRRALIGAGVVALWLCSTPLVGQRLFRNAEGWAERDPVADAAAADAIVVLSAGRLVPPGPASISEWQDPDRFFGGVELFQAGKAPLLLFTGGWIPGNSTAPLEGETLKEFATALGVPPDQVATTGLVMNTADEARAVATLMRHRLATPARILLVTSAFHMSRAQQLFEQEGLAVTPFPVDFRVPTGVGLTLLDVLPSAEALQQTQTAVREAYGRLFYRLLSS